MVKVIQSDGQTRYQCEVCQLKYEDEVWADKCQSWCSEHSSCNLEIIDHAVAE